MTTMRICTEVALQVCSGVNRVILTLRRRLPMYPDKQTFSESLCMSQRCLQLDR
jgi:hypothetical protein